MVKVDINYLRKVLKVDFLDPDGLPLDLDATKILLIETKVTKDVYFVLYINIILIYNNLILESAFSDILFLDV